MRVRRCGLGGLPGECIRGKEREGMEGMGKREGEVTERKGKGHEGRGTETGGKGRGKGTGTATEGQEEREKMQRRGTTGKEIETRGWMDYHVFERGSCRLGFGIVFFLCCLPVMAFLWSYFPSPFLSDSTVWERNSPVVWDEVVP